jgi:hypothetical protein
MDELNPDELHDIAEELLLEVFCILSQLIKIEFKF